MKLKSEQTRLYESLPQDVRCFVRVCDDDSALWVSDLPRKQSSCYEMTGRLHEEGFRMWLDEKSKLCYMDWTMERWQEEISSLPQGCPRFPAQEEYHEAFALCRLWLMHPSELEEAHLPMLRRVVKLTAEPPVKLLRAVRGLHEAAAAQLREGKTVSYAAGRVLAAWIHEHAYGKETQP